MISDPGPPFRCARKRRIGVGALEPEPVFPNPCQIRVRRSLQQGFVAPLPYEAAGDKFLGDIEEFRSAGTF